METQLYERRDTLERGRHLVSTQAIEKGTLIYCERPLLSLQSVGNAHSGALVCRHCRCFIGGPHISLGLAAGARSRQELFEKTSNKDDDSKNSKSNETKNEGYYITPCRDGCGEVYCSPECEQAMIEYFGHDLLCTGNIEEVEEKQEDSSNEKIETISATEETEKEQIPQHPLIQFKVHAIQNNEIYLMVADCITSVISRRRRQLLDSSNVDLGTITTPKDNNTKHFTEKTSKSISTILTPYMDFTLVPWWEVATLSSSSSQEENKTLDETLRRLCDDSAKLLLDSLRAHIESKELEQNMVNNPEYSKRKQEQYLWNTATKQAIEDCSQHMECGIKLISGHFFGKIIGSFEQNAIGIRARHPLCRDIFSKALREEALNDIAICIQKADMSDDDEDDEIEEESIDQDAEDTDHKDDNKADSIPNGDDEEEAENEEPYTLSEVTEYLASLEINEDDTPDGDNLDQIFVPLDGTAMFATTCKMNHSCEPNVLVRYRAGWGEYRPLVLQCIALKDIKEGEELCISYINTDGALDERKEELKNYGFECFCQKCQKECASIVKSQISEDGEEDIDQSKEENVDDLFGSDDESDDENIIDNSESNNNLDSEQTLQNRILDILTKSSSQEYPGRIPLAMLAQVTSFIMQEGQLAYKEFQQLSTKSIDDYSHDETILMMEALQSSIDAIDKRNFELCQSSGTKGETVGLSSLQTNGSWSHTAWRVAYGCCSVVSAMGYAGNGYFLEALQMLDKACILGLPREKLGRFIDYVELHATECRGKFHSVANFKCEDGGNGLGFIKDYCKPDMRYLVEKKGLSKPISLQIPEEFFEEGRNVNRIQHEFISPRQPVVIRNFASQWPAVEKWRNLEFFWNEFGHRIVPIEIGSILSEKKMSEKLMTVCSFIEKYLEASCAKDCFSLSDSDPERKNGEQEHLSVAYLAQHRLFDQIPSLIRDVVVTPSLCGVDEVAYKNVWMGTGGTRTPLHFDSFDNLFVQIAGVKYVRIYDISESDKLYVMKNKENSYGLQGNMSELDCEKEDFGKHPMTLDAKYIETLMFPGDCLFIPARAWHYVRSLSTSVSVNYWW